MQRRSLLLAALVARGLPAQAAAAALRFPRDFGAHLATRSEWWYVTGWLGSEAEPRWGLQLTFFRSRTGLAENQGGRFAARQLLVAHAAVSEIGARRHRLAQRVARWSGAPDAPLAAASRTDTDLRLAGWSLVRGASGYRARARAPEFGFDLELAPTQPVLLQGEAGVSRKGPLAAEVSRYYSEPQLALQARLEIGGRRVEATGRAWLDHEWSDEFLAPEAVGWDWIGINLFDGSALTAFRLRRADASVFWAGGSWRAPKAAAQSFAPDEVGFEPGPVWTSPASGARYPLQWRIRTPAGTFGLRALFEAQEVDARASTGASYWEGLAELLDAGGRRIGLGYLELTGYAARQSTG
ncbi:MAG: carotenoid 1,2-hydratase [Burkholderiales bacterium]|nr:carotenoid 1,2-hydratase [Burkholderiales bacterium]